MEVEQEPIEEAVKLSSTPVSLSEKQSIAWQFLEDNITTELFYGGAAGGGKSMLGCVWHIYRRTAYPKTRGLIGRNELKNLKESTLITLFKMCDIMGYRAGVHYWYNDVKSIINWWNGSRTILKELKYQPSDPDFQSLGSTEYTDAFIDEAPEVVERCAEIISSRLRWMLKEYKLKPKLLLTGNPGFHWIRYRFVKNLKGNPVVLKNFQKFIPALVTDNPDKAFVEIYTEQLEKMSSDYDRQRLQFGDWDATPKTGGEFYKHFRGDKHIGDIRYNPDLPIHLTFDFNVNPYCTGLAFQTPSIKEIHQIAEFTMASPHNSTKGVCRAFREAFRNHNGGLYIYGDPAGRHEDTRQESGHNDYTIIITELDSYKPVTRLWTKAPSIVMRGNFINEVFLNNFEGLKILFNKGCVNTIADFSNCKEASDGTKDKKKITDANKRISYEQWGHCSDAFDYLYTRMYGDQYSNFQRGGMKVAPKVGKMFNKNSY